jgi:hypothetical protein
MRAAQCSNVPILTRARTCTSTILRMRNNSLPSRRSSATKKAWYRQHHLRLNIMRLLTSTNRLLLGVCTVWPQKRHLLRAWMLRAHHSSMRLCRYSPCGTDVVHMRILSVAHYCANTSTELGDGIFPKKPTHFLTWIGTTVMARNDA